MKKRTVFILLLLAALGARRAEATYTIYNVNNPGSGTTPGSIISNVPTGTLRYVAGRLNSTTGDPNSNTIIFNVGNIDMGSNAVPLIARPVAFNVADVLTSTTITSSTGVLIMVKDNVGLTLSSPKLYLQNTGTNAVVDDHTWVVGVSTYYDVGYLKINGDLASHLVSIQNGNTGKSSALYGRFSLTMDGSITGSVVSSATSSAKAYGLYSEGPVSIGGVGSYSALSSQGLIEVSSNGGLASGISTVAIFNDKNITITGAIDGHITATTTGSNEAYGIYSNGIPTPTIVYGVNVGGGLGVNSLVKGDAGWDRGYGIYTPGAVTISGGLKGNALTTSGATIEAHAGRSYAFGIQANQVTISGDIERYATIKAYADGLSSYDIVGQSTLNQYGSAFGVYAPVYPDPIYSYEGKVVFNGKFSGNVDVRAQKTAYGICADIIRDDYSYTGFGNVSFKSGFDGEITVKTLTTAAPNDTDRTCGIYARQINFDENAGTLFSGRITVWSSNVQSYGLYADTGNSQYGGVSFLRGFGPSGIIDVNSDDSSGVSNNAFGIYSSNDSDFTTSFPCFVDVGGTEANGFAGTIRSTSKTANAFGIFGSVAMTGDATHPALAASALIDATGSTGAYGISGSLTLNGDMSNGARVRATATGAGEAFGVSASLLQINGSMNGTITAEGSDSASRHVVGVYANDYDSYIQQGIGETGRITATTQGSNAVGLGSGLDFSIGDYNYPDAGISGVISASAVLDAATGIDCSANFTIHGGLGTYDPASGKGLISAVAGRNQANGIHSSELTVNGTIQGKIYAEATTGIRAYGLYSTNGMHLSGGISSTALIEAKAGSKCAFGMADEGGGMHGADPDSPLVIAGTVRATAAGDAVGILSAGSMNLRITGTVSGTDNTAGGALGYAIRSGNFDASGNFIAGPYTAVDRVEVLDHGRLVGKVVLDAGDDAITLAGHADVSKVPMLDGGAGTLDTLTLSGWRTDNDATTTDIPLGFGGNVTGWEVIMVEDDASGNHSDVYLGPTPDVNTPMTFSPSAGQTLQMTIEAGSIVRATGSSPGRYVIAGNLTNAGSLSMYDGKPDDRVTVTGTYTALSGSTLVLDVPLGEGSQGWSERETLDLLEVGSSTGTGTGTRIVVHNYSGTTVRKTTDSGNGILVVKLNGSNTGASFTIDDKDPVFQGATVQLAALTDGWYLQILGDGSGGGGDEPPPPPPPEHPDAGTTVYSIGTLGYDSMPRFHERQAYGWSAPGQEREPASWWMRTTGTRFRTELESGGFGYRTSGYRNAMQVGADLSACRYGGTLYLKGIFVGTSYLKADNYGSGDAKSGTTEVFGMGLGGYASVEQRGSWYAEAVVQANRWDISSSVISTGTKPGAKTWSYGASVEGGAYVKVLEGFRLEPQAQLMWQRIEGYGMQVTAASMAMVESMNGLQGRLGVAGMVMPKGWCVSPLFELNAVREFGDDAEVSWSQTGQSYGVNMDRTWLGGALGIVSRNARPEWLEYSVKAGAMLGVDGHRGRDWAISASIRKSW